MAGMPPAEGTVDVGDGRSVESKLLTCRLWPGTKSDVGDSGRTTPVPRDELDEGCETWVEGRVRRGTIVVKPI